MPVYLIHFTEKLAHAGHYVGFAENDVAARFEDHLKGRGSRILAHLNQIGKTYMLVRIWSSGDRKLERRLKNRKDAPKLCPVCSPDALRWGNYAPTD